MNHSLKVLALIFSIVICSYLLTHTYTTTTNKPSFSIALMYPASHPAMDEIEKGIKETLNQKNTYYEVTVFNGQSNRSIMQAQAAQLVHSSYDCICTIGTVCTHLVTEQLKKNTSQKPLVFTAVTNPTELGLLQNSTLQVTGISSTDEYEKQLILIKKIKPDLRSLLLVYDPTQGTGKERDKRLIISYGKSLDINVTPLEISQAHDIPQRVPPFLPSHDAVMILKDHTVVTALDALVRLCNESNTLLYASDLNSGAQGATLAFGIYDYEYGKQAALLIDQICRYKKQACTLPITSESGKKLYLNTKLLTIQKINLSNDQINELKKIVDLAYD